MVHSTQYKNGRFRGHGFRDATIEERVLKNRWDSCVHFSSERSFLENAETAVWKAFAQNRF